MTDTTKKTVIPPPKQTNVKITDLIPDIRNYNLGNEEGNKLIEKSLKKFGAGRSVLIDRNDRLIGGNKTIENAKKAGITDVIIVETTGNQIVAVKRMDLDIDSAKGREMAIADNATAKANITWDMPLLQNDWKEEQLAAWNVLEVIEEPPPGKAVSFTAKPKPDQELIVSLTCKSMAQKFSILKLLKDAGYEELILKTP